MHDLNMISRKTKEVFGEWKSRFSSINPKVGHKVMEREHNQHKT